MLKGINRILTANFDKWSCARLCECARLFVSPKLTFVKLTLWTTADEIRTSYTLSPPLELCPAARGLGSRVTLGETDCVNYARLARAMWAATQ